MSSYKRRRTNGSNYASKVDDGEPPVDININANTATVLIDTKQNNITPPYSDYGVLPSNEVLVANSVSTRNISYNIEGKNSANIIAQINAMSGCQRFRYFGDFSSDSDYGFHTGNNLIAIRFLVTGGGDSRVLDLFCKLPEGLSFMTNDVDAEYERLVDYINDLFTKETWFYARNVYYNGSEGFALPGAGVWHGGAPLQCLLTGDKRLHFFIEDNDLLNGYDVTFRFFDHPNSIFRRGANITGTGVLSTNSTDAGKAVYYVYDDIIFPPQSYSSLAVPAALFSDLDEGIIANGLDFVAISKATNGKVKTYIAQRTPCLLDARYYIINIPEATFDSKTGIITNQLAISFTTVGVQLLDFFTKRNREFGEDNENDFVFTNPTTNLAPNCSTMSLQVERLNSFGETTYPGLVQFGKPTAAHEAAWPAGGDPEEQVNDYLCRNILMNTKKGLGGAPIAGTENPIDSEYLDNQVRLGPADSFIHFGLNYMV